MLTSLTDLRREFAARGFDYLDRQGSTARQDQYLNQAYLELCEEEPWPFLVTEKTGAAPLVIDDLRAVQSVYETSQRRQLPYAERRALVDGYGDLSLAGSPAYFYIVLNAVATYPNGGELTVTYFKVPAELTDPAHEPIVPLRFRNLIVDGAARRAYIDSDNFEAASAVEGERQAGIDRMRQSLLWQNLAVPEYVAVAEGTDW